MIKRNLVLDTLLEEFPAVAILGPRQVGKTTLAKTILRDLTLPPLYLDLEKPSDIAKLSDPELYLNNHFGRLVILDEVQRMPGIFQILRGIIDERRLAGERGRQFLLLGSASKDLLKQSSESLAGRIIYTELGGLNIQEVAEHDTLWLRGGFPDSFLASSDEFSMTWRESFVTTYLERDIRQLGYNISSALLRRFWTMLAHIQGDLVNASKIASGLGVSTPTVMRYIDLFEDLFLIRVLRPWYSNCLLYTSPSPRD